MNQSAPTPNSPHRYQLHCDGLGTFLSLAASVLAERQRKGEITLNDALMLQNQVHTSNFNFGAAIEALGMERLEYINDPNSATAAALMLAGRYIQEMADIAATLNAAQARHLPAPAVDSF